VLSSTLPAPDTEQEPIEGVDATPTAHVTLIMLWSLMTGWK
jgi:hypothetical protein